MLGFYLIHLAERIGLSHAPTMYRIAVKVLSKGFDD